MDPREMTEELGGHDPRDMTEQLDWRDPRSATEPPDEGGATNPWSARRP